MKNLTAWLLSPIGPLEISGTADGISRIAFARQSPPGPGRMPDELAPAVRELEEYFRGERRVFTFALALAGTAFQKSVWDELAKIPFGTTTTYGGIAAVLGRPGGARAVGQANHLNPAAVVIPCHRVISSRSELTGYGGGLWRKRWLLEHERSVASAGRPARPTGRAGSSPGRE